MSSGRADETDASWPNARGQRSAGTVDLPGRYEEVRAHAQRQERTQQYELQGHASTGAGARTSTRTTWARTRARARYTLDEKYRRTREEQQRMHEQEFQRMQE